VIVTAPGEESQVDYGTGPMVRDPASGKYRRTRLFVLTLGYSRKAVRLLVFQSSSRVWAELHEKAFRRLGGATRIVVLDNLGEGVLTPDIYDPTLNPLYRDVLAHYGALAMPCRVGDPDRKAKVKAGVLLVERWILAALRKRKFFSLAELNQAIEELLVRLNNRPFRKRDGSRRSLFESLDKPALRALPTERYEYGDWETHRVNIDYHVEFDHHWYSVPYQLTQQEVEVRATAATVEIFHRGVRVASHARSQVPHAATTVNDHRPKAHQRHLEWTPSRLVDWAKTIGPATAELFDRIMASKRHPEQGYRSCLGILRLSKQYTSQRVEAAARRAIALHACSYQSVKSILQCNLDSQTIEPAAEPKPPLDHPNIRGSEYFDTTDEDPNIQ